MSFSLLSASLVLYLLFVLPRRLKRAGRVRGGPGDIYYKAGIKMVTARPEMVEANVCRAGLCAVYALQHSFVFSEVNRVTKK